MTSIRLYLNIDLTIHLNIHIKTSLYNEETGKTSSNIHTITGHQGQKQTRVSQRV